MLTSSLPLKKKKKKKKGLKQGQVCNAPTLLLIIFVAHFDIYITASHLPGVINVTADHLSRGNMRQAFEVAPTLTTSHSYTPFCLQANFSLHT